MSATPSMAAKVRAIRLLMRYAALQGSSSQAPSIAEELVRREGDMVAGALADGLHQAQCDDVHKTDCRHDQAAR